MIPFPAAASVLFPSAQAPIAVSATSGADARSGDSSLSFGSYGSGVSNYSLAIVVAAALAALFIWKKK